jgi:hypothetical protein
MAKLDDQLAQLETLSPAALGDEWRRITATEPPRLPPDLLRHGVAYALQEKALGGLPRRLARQLDASSSRARAPTALRPGAQLVRSWNGRTIDVLVTNAGFEFNDRTFRSLTAIAREVTGAAWSGPRFFGLVRG